MGVHRGDELEIDARIDEQAQRAEPWILDRDRSLGPGDQFDQSRPRADGLSQGIDREQRPTPGVDDGPHIGQQVSALAGKADDALDRADEAGRR